MTLNFELPKFSSVLQILELPSHPFYVGVQFHPEFKSRPGRPSALFLGTKWSTNEPCISY